LFNIVFENETTKDINLEFLNKILLDISPKPIELILTTNEHIKQINKDTRGIDKPTDVLSFPYMDMPNTPLGSIVISTNFVEDKATLYSHSYEDELTLLFIHGLLHLVGYDHEVDDGEHREKEEQMIKKYDLPNSLIVRNS